MQPLLAIKMEEELNGKISRGCHKVHQSNFPTYFQMIKNLAMTTKDFVKDDFRLSDMTLWEERYTVCKRCEQFRNSRCISCGCFMKIKTAINASKCPLDKWNDIQLTLKD